MTRRYRRYKARLAAWHPDRYARVCMVEEWVYAVAAVGAVYLVGHMVLYLGRM